MTTRASISPAPACSECGCSPPRCQYDDSRGATRCSYTGKPATSQIREPTVVIGPTVGGERFVVGVDVGFDDTASIVVASRASDGTVTIHDVEVSKAAAISVAAVAASLRRSIDARTT